MAGKDNVRTLTTILLVLCRILSVDGRKCPFTLFHRRRYSIWNASIRQSSLVILLDCEHIHNPVLVCLFVRWFSCLRDLSCLSIHIVTWLWVGTLFSAASESTLVVHFIAANLSNHTHIRFCFYYLSHIILCRHIINWNNKWQDYSPNSQFNTLTRDQQQSLYPCSGWTPLLNLSCGWLWIKL